MQACNSFSKQVNNFHLFNFFSFLKVNSASNNIRNNELFVDQEEEKDMELKMKPEEKFINTLYTLVLTNIETERKVPKVERKYTIERAR